MTLDYSKHKNILLQILKDIYTDTSIAPYLGFKGGTAALLFYDLPRSSVDLDFDLLDDSKEREVFATINKIIQNYGTITDAYMQKHTLRNVISYSPKAQNIKVEVNLRQFGSKYEVKTLLGISMLVMVQEDMFAHKLMAMYERIGKTSRDIFDVQFFGKNDWPINRKIVEQRSGLSYKETLEKCREKVRGMDNKYILNGLGELLTDSQKDSTRAKLKTDTIFQLDLMLRNTSEVDSISPYLASEIKEIQDIVNEELLAKKSSLTCNNLKIVKKIDAFFENSNKDNVDKGYIINCEIAENGKTKNISLTREKKISVFDTANQIVNKILA